MTLEFGCGEQYIYVYCIHNISIIGTFFSFINFHQSKNKILKHIFLSLIQNWSSFQKFRKFREKGVVFRHKREIKCFFSRFFKFFNWMSCIVIEFISNYLNFSLKYFFCNQNFSEII